MEPLSAFEIFTRVMTQFTPVWIALVVTFVVSIYYKRSLGLYGKMFDSVIGMIGFGMVMFWVYTAIFAGAFDMIGTHSNLTQIAQMKNELPGSPMANFDPESGLYPYYLLGGDNLGRDVFSRMVDGSVQVMLIAPIATMFAFMVGITLGLPAGYFGETSMKIGSPSFLWSTGVVLLLSLIGLFFAGLNAFFIIAVIGTAFILAFILTSLDTVLSFIANLILAFPVILLFYLLVTPELRITGIPTYMGMVLFLFPVIFFAILINSKYKTRPNLNTPLLIGVVGGLMWLYISIVNQPGTPIDFLGAIDLFNIDGGLLTVFVSVVFVNSPTVFRIVRGLALDIQTRDYVAAAQTRGEGSFYIMLWEILPNARGPLIVDFCLRIGYTTILLGTLGFFGLGLAPEDPNWGATINEGRKLLSIFPHAAIVPALALLSLVLGLNLLADGLREQSLKD